MPARASLRHVAVTLCLVAAVWSVSACSASKDDQELVIGIAPGSTEQAVLGDVYVNLLESVGQPARAEFLPEDVARDPAPEIVRSGGIHMAITCTARVLEQQAPRTYDEVLDDATEHARENGRGEAEEAGNEAGAVVNDETVSKATYAAAVATFPGDVMTVDPSPAESCGDADLPQSVIPVFQKSLLNRGQLNRLNFVNRQLSTDALQEMAADVDAGEPLRDVVGSWMTEHARVTVDTHSTEEGESGAEDNVLDQPPV